MANDEQPAAPAPATEERYPTQGCVTLLLRFWIITSVASLLILPVLDRIERLPFFREEFPNYEGWAIIPWGVGSVLVIVFSVALLARRMWGFIGLWVVGLASMAVNIALGVKFAHAVSGLIGLLILYWLLQVGGEKSGWSKLR